MKENILVSTEHITLLRNYFVDKVQSVDSISIMLVGVHDRKEQSPNSRTLKIGQASNESPEKMDQINKFSQDERLQEKWEYITKKRQLMSWKNE